MVIESTSPQKETRNFTASTLLGLITIFAICYIRGPWRKLPPGPQHLPTIWNALQLMDKKRPLSRDCKERFGALLITYPGGC